MSLAFRAIKLFRIARKGARDANRAIGKRIQLYFFERYLCRRNIVFLHIPKTAGTSVTHYLRRQFHPDNHFLGGYGDRVVPKNGAFGFYYAAHVSWDELSAVPGEYAIISFLRDPEKRLNSVYNFVRNSKRTIPDWDEYSQATRQHSFKDWLGMLLDENIARKQLVNGNDNAYLRILAGSSLTGNIALISDADAVPLMELARKRIDEMVVCGIVERYDESMQLIAKRLGLRPPKFYDLVKKNVTRKSDPAGSDTATAEAMGVLTRFDRELYNYACAKL